MSESDSEHAKLRRKDHNAMWARDVCQWFHQRFQQRKTWIVVTLTCLTFAFFFTVWHGPLPFEGLVTRLAHIDSWHFASDTVTVRKYYGLSLAAAFGFIGFLLLLAVIWQRLSAATQQLLWRLVATIACSCALGIYMSKIEFELIPIDVLMVNPSAKPIYGHRLLFVWIAKVFHAASPSSSYLRSYYASQVVATLLTLYAVGRWSAIYVGESLSWLGQVLAVVMISTCFGYRNFYDIGIVFFFTCGLLALYRRRYWWLPIIVMIGTLNHENILLLVFIAAFLIFDKEPRRVWLPVILVSLVAHIAMRTALQAAIPFQRQVDWRFWTNMVKPFVIPHEMAYSLLALGGWYALGLMSLRDCDPRLQRLILLFPLLFAVTFSFGQFHEPRQFDAFIPVLIGLLLDRSRRYSQVNCDRLET